jgi:hypothetical protein
VADGTTPAPRLLARTHQGCRTWSASWAGTALIGNNELLLATQRHLPSADRTLAENASGGERQAAREARRRSSDNPSAEPDGAEEPDLDEPAAVDLAEAA